MPSQRTNDIWDITTVCVPILQPPDILEVCRCRPQQQPLQYCATTVSLSSSNSHDDDDDDDDDDSSTSHGSDDGEHHIIDIDNDATTVVSFIDNHHPSSTVQQRKQAHQHRLQTVRARIYFIIYSYPSWLYLLPCPWVIISFVITTTNWTIVVTTTTTTTTTSVGWQNPIYHPWYHRRNQQYCRVLIQRETRIVTLAERASRISGINQCDWFNAIIKYSVSNENHHASHLLSKRIEESQIKMVQLKDSVTIANRSIERVRCIAHSQFLI